MDLPVSAKSVHNCTFCLSLRSQPPQPLGNPMFLSQLCVIHNVVASVNLVRAADYTVEVDSQWAALHVVQKFDFPPSSRSQLPQPLGNPMFLPQLPTGYNFAAGSNLVRGACRMLFAPGSCSTAAEIFNVAPDAHKSNKCIACDTAQAGGSPLPISCPVCSPQDPLAPPPHPSLPPPPVRRHRFQR